MFVSFQHTGLCAAVLCRILPRQDKDQVRGAFWVKPGLKLNKSAQHLKKHLQSALSLVHLQVSKVLHACNSPFNRSAIPGTTEQA